MAVPYRLPWDVNVVRVNYRCLKPPVPYTDLDGYYCMPPVIRRIVPGLIEVPKSGVVPIQPRALHEMMLPILERFTAAPLDFDSLPPHIFEFGVDIPFTAYKPS